MQFIALCGYPKAGKTEVQKIISARYGFLAYDDSKPLRDAVKTLYGLTDWHVTTQEGKSSLVSTGDDTDPVTVRKILGDLGCYLEDRDPFHFPRLAVKTCLEQAPQGRFVFASVRLNQGLFYKQTGKTLIIEVTRKGCGPSDVFDTYLPDPIDLSIENIYDSKDPEGSRHHLATRIAQMLDPILGTPAATRDTLDLLV